jgi:hypothetical protein
MSRRRSIYPKILVFGGLLGHPENALGLVLGKQGLLPVG